MTTHRAEITSLAARYRLPAVYPFRHYTEIGGLLSYGMTSVIIFGARRPMPIASSKAKSRASFPSKLPVKFELVINLKTAKTLGLTVPPTLLSRADAVIE